MRRRQCTDSPIYRYRGATREKLVLARRLRGCPTGQETTLWDAIRARQLGGFKFRRQHVLAGFIADFYCPAARLVVEVDGASHRGREPYDAGRDEIFGQLGIAVMRISNESVECDLVAVLDSIHRFGLGRAGRLSRPRIRGAGQGGG